MAITKRSRPLVDGMPDRPTKAPRRGFGGARRATSAFGTATAIVLAVASAAWGCAALQGSVSICSPSTATCTIATKDGGQTSKGSGLPGSVIKVGSAGLKPSPAKYTLYFASYGSGLNCHTTTKVLSSPAGVLLMKMTTNAAGDLDKNLATSAVEPYKALIPSGAPQGDAYICAREKYPTPANSMTAHATFTVMGGTA